MSNEPVDTGVEIEGQDELEEQQQTQTQQQTPDSVHFRIKAHEVVFYQRMADYFWRQGLIREPSLHLLGRACLNIVANKWAKLEERNYNEYVQRRLRAVGLTLLYINGRSNVKV